jgi:hypothetical protein
MRGVGMASLAGEFSQLGTEAFVNKKSHYTYF